MAPCGTDKVVLEILQSAPLRGDEKTDTAIRPVVLAPSHLHPTPSPTRVSPSLSPESDSLSTTFAITILLVTITSTYHHPRSLHLPTTWHNCAANATVTSNCPSPFAVVDLSRHQHRRTTQTNNKTVSSTNLCSVSDGADDESDAVGGFLATNAFFKVDDDDGTNFDTPDDAALPKRMTSTSVVALEKQNGTEARSSTAIHSALVFDVHGLCICTKPLRCDLGRAHGCVDGIALTVLQLFEV